MLVAVRVLEPDVAVNVQVPPPSTTPGTIAATSRAFAAASQSFVVIAGTTAVRVSVLALGALVTTGVTTGAGVSDAIDSVGVGAGGNGAAGGPPVTRAP